MEDTDVKIANVMDLESLGRSISPIAKRCNITGVFLFGSRARGDFDENSDYDLVVDVNDDYDIGDHVRFIDDVSKLSAMMSTSLPGAALLMIGSRRMFSGRWSMSVENRRLVEDTSEQTPLIDFCTMN